MGCICSRSKSSEKPQTILTIDDYPEIIFPDADSDIYGEDTEDSQITANNN